jgi:hypothetical protein
MFWDRLFGTYLPEPKGQELRYGIEDGAWGHNPLKIQFGPLLAYGRGLWEARQRGSGASRGETIAPPTTTSPENERRGYTKADE